MELNQLNHFRTVARLENVTKAAEELFVSQPNLSTSISRLESNLGVQLFSRSKGRIKLTENGKIFLHHVNRIFQELDIAVEEIRTAQEYREDSINVAANFTRILSALFSHYYVDYGLLPTSQMVYAAPMIEKGLEDHSIDLAIVMGRLESDKIAWEPIYTEPVIAVMKADNPLPRREIYSLKDFRLEHFICNELFFSRDLLIDLCQKADFVPNIVRTSNEQEIFDEKSFDFGRNIVLCPLHMVPELSKSEHFDLRLAPLSDYFAEVTIGLAQSKSQALSPILKEFYIYARQEIGQILTDQLEEGQHILERSRLC